MFPRGFTCNALPVPMLTPGLCWGSFFEPESLKHPCFFIGFKRFSGAPYRPRLTSFWEASWRFLGMILGGFWDTKIAPKRAQDGANMAPRRCQDGPRWRQDGRTRAQNASKTAQDAFKRPARRPERLQYASSRSQEAARSSQDPPRAFKRPPRRFQETPRDS